MVTLLSKKSKSPRSQASQEPQEQEEHRSTDPQIKKWGDIHPGRMFGKALQDSISGYCCQLLADLAGVILALLLTLSFIFGSRASI